MDLVLRIGLATVFLGSAVLKAKSWQLARSDLMFLGARAATAAVWLTVSAESLLAIAIIAAPGKWWTAQAGIIILIAFTLFYCVRLSITGYTSCACFGRRTPFAGEDNRSVLARANAVSIHCIGNGVLLFTWAYCTLGDSSPAPYQLVVLGMLPSMLGLVSVASLIARTKRVMRLPLHPDARSMTVDTVHLGRCKRIGGNAGLSRTEIIRTRGPLSPLLRFASSDGE